ncbi:hypothetical protein DL95DRAFT_378484 [Leptodontidium sp. 2 PMI_412]|nr:hypothetical protein DL95DRAFT_378484 [Leptodontidium sp. 2 PMI_412]
MAPAASGQARPFYKRIYRGIVHAMRCLWLGIRNFYDSPFVELPLHWIPLLLYLTNRLVDLDKQGDLTSLWYATGIVLFLVYSTDMSFRGERRGRIYTLWALEGLSSDERNAKIDEMWLKYGWSPLEPEKADQDLPVAEETKQPLLVEV